VLEEQNYAGILESMYLKDIKCFFSVILLDPLFYLLIYYSNCVRSMIQTSFYVHRHGL